MEEASEEDRASALNDLNAASRKQGVRALALVIVDQPHNQLARLRGGKLADNGLVVGGPSMGTPQARAIRLAFIFAGFHGHQPVDQLCFVLRRHVSLLVKAFASRFPTLRSNSLYLCKYRKLAIGGNYWLDLFF
jgi:hypothetical protein